GENESNRTNDNNANDRVANCRMRVIVSCLLGKIMNRTYRTYKPYKSYKSDCDLYDDFQFINSDFDRLPGFDFGLFAGLNFTSVGFDRVPPHAFQLIRVVVASGQDRVFAADLLVAFEFQIDEKIFRAAADLDSVLVRGKNP